MTEQSPLAMLSSSWTTGVKWAYTGPGRFGLQSFHVSFDVIGHFAQHGDGWHVVRRIRETAALRDASAHILDDGLPHESSNDGELQQFLAFETKLHVLSSGNSLALATFATRD